MEKLFTINIGKKGLNENVLKEILRQLKSKKIVKVKFLKNIVEVKDREELKSYFDIIFDYLNENINKEEKNKNNKTNKNYKVNKFKVFREKTIGFTTIFYVKKN